MFFPFPVAQQLNSGLSRLFVEVSRSHTISLSLSLSLSVTHTVGFLWTSDQLVAYAATNTAHNKHKERTSRPWAEFEPAIPSIQRLQNYTYRTPTVINRKRGLATLNYSMYIYTEPTHEKLLTGQGNYHLLPSNLVGKIGKFVSLSKNYGFPSQNS
jgi:hypothetical protein